MKIIKLYAENVKRIKAVEIQPTENVIVISGKNGQGKTSVLDSIWFALGGGNAMKDVPEPIRKGEPSAEVRLELDNLIVTRTWNTAGNTYLKVETKDTMTSLKSPQAVLDALMDKVAFDPLEFSRMGAIEQRTVLMKSVGLYDEFQKIDNLKATLYEERTNIGRELKQHEALAKSLEEDFTGVPNQQIEVESYMEELNQANEHNKNIMRFNSDLKISGERVEGYRYEIERLNAEIDKETYIFKAIGEKLNLMQEIPEAKIQQKIIELNTANRKVEKKKQYIKECASVKDFQEQYKGATEYIEDFEVQKRALLGKANMPVTGLTVSENEILYKDIPFTQIAESEKLKISLAMVIAQKPELRVVRITDGSLLDNDNMEVLKSVATRFDFQIWIEQVSDSGTVGIYIEDGEIKTNNYEKKAE